MNLADARETALGRRATNAEKEWLEHTRALPTMKVGDNVMIQNQSGNHPLCWDKRGTIVAESFDQYQVMVDGLRRLTRQNRRYLRLFTPFQPDMVLPCRLAAAMKTTEAVPSASRNMRQLAPIEVQRQHDQQCEEPVEVHHLQSQRQPAVPRHGGYVYKPLGECPTRGTVSDLLE